MKPSSFFTRRIMGMDYRVWGTMIITCFLSLGLYSYKHIRLNTLNNQPCPEDTITINGKTTDMVAACDLKRISTFGFQSEAAATVKWNFGDGSAVETGQIVSHKFSRKGTYNVTAMVNGSCEYYVDVDVTDDEDLPEDGNPVIEVYADPKHPSIGTPVKLYCVSDLSSISSYQWRVLETKEVRNDAVPIFTFDQARNHTIELMVNGDPSTLTTSVIKVNTGLQQPPATADDMGAGAGAPVDMGPIGRLVPPGANGSGSEKDPAKPDGGLTNVNPGTGTQPADSAKAAAMPKAREVDPNAFKDLLQNVIDENGKEPEDLFEFLDYKASTMVEVNGDDKSLVSLKAFCKKMRGKKKNKRKIESLKFQIDDKKSIQTIKVKVPESGGLWEKINPF